MVIYNFKRAFVNGAWTINNPFDVDAKGKSVPLAMRIKNDPIIGGFLQTVVLDSTNCDISMSQLLSDAQDDILKLIVENHEAATGTINHESAIYLTSPDGQEWMVCIDNTGSLFTEPT